MLRKNKHFSKKFENNRCFDGERYRVKSAFTKSFSRIPDNFSNSFTRLKNLNEKLQNNDKLTLLPHPTIVENKKETS